MECPVPPKESSDRDPENVYRDSHRCSPLYRENVTEFLVPNCRPGYARLPVYCVLDSNDCFRAALKDVTDALVYEE